MCNKKIFHIKLNYVGHFESQSKYVIKLLKLFSKKAEILRKFKCIVAVYERNVFKLAQYLSENGSK